MEQFESIPVRAAFSRTMQVLERLSKQGTLQQQASLRRALETLRRSLPAAEESAMAILRALAAIPVFTLGERQASRLPVVLEAPDGSTARYWHEWVEQLPGVIQVEVAFVSFDESEPVSGRLTSAVGDE